MHDSLRRWPWFAIALAPYPLLYIAAANPGQVDAASLLPALAAAVAASLALLTLLRLLLGNWFQAGLGVAWLLLLFFSYGPVNARFDGAGGEADEGLAAVHWAADNLQLVHSAIWLLLLVLGWFHLTPSDWH